MNKIGQYLYNTIFWISRLITISIFGICFFAVLNAKYLWSDTFFSKLLYNSLDLSLMIHKLFHISIKPLSILKFSLFSDPNILSSNIINKYNIYKFFCINSQYIDTLIYSFLLILLIYFSIKYIFKFKNKKLFFSIILTLCLVYFLIYLFNKNANFFILSLISSISFIILYFFNTYLPLQNIIMLIPILGEIFCINKIIFFITNRKQKEFFILIVSIIVSNIFFIFMPYYSDKLNNLVMKSSIYNIIFDKKQDIFVISSQQILLVNDITKKNDKIENIFNLYQQDIAVNWEKEEIYLYSAEDGMFYIIDINTKNKKTEIKILNFEDSKKNIGARLVYNSTTNFILIVFESDFGAFLVDLDKLQIIQKYEILSPNDAGIYNKFRNSFLLTYYQVFDVIQEIKLNDNSVNNITVGSEQGYIAISEKNKEVYIAFHQQGRIGVYDAETMAFKRKIKTNYTVKDITYDDDLNILIAPSYFTGYVDIFLMDGSDTLLTRRFVGYALREAKFDTKKENLYVCSRNGLYKFPINIKELIKQYKNVSHETLNNNI